MAPSEEEYIPLDTEPSPKSQTEEVELLEFSPSNITLETFNDLLARYPTTVETVIRSKETAKALKAATAREKKTRAKGKNDDVQPTLTAAEKQYVDRQVSAYLSLDEFRYGSLPARVRERASAAAATEEKEKTDGGGYLEKDELVQLMEWKLKHGVYRPTLLGLVRSNPAELIRRTTASAFAAVYPDPATELVSGGAFAVEDMTLDHAFPKQSLEALTSPLRGVGPATASLILSVAPESVPFYSDDVFLWLCVGVFPSATAAAAEKRIRPNGELNVKYNLHEYRLLWEAVQRLRGRLGADVVSCADVEKVAFVLRHIDASGYSVGDGAASTSAQEVEGTKRKPDQDVQEGEERSERSSKRRR